MSWRPRKGRENDLVNSKFRMTSGSCFVTSFFFDKAVAIDTAPSLGVHRTCSPFDGDVGDLYFQPLPLLHDEASFATVMNAKLEESTQSVASPTPGLTDGDFPRTS